MNEEQQVERESEVAETPEEGTRTATALTGFFAGLALVLLVPVGFAAVLALAFDQHTVEELFPLVLVLLALPLVLLGVSRTRLFGRYMLVGMLLTAVVVVGVAAAVLWVMVETQG